MKLGLMTWHTEMHDMVQVYGIIEDVLRQEAEQARDIIRNLELIRTHFNMNYCFLCLTAANGQCGLSICGRIVMRTRMTDYSDVNAVLKGPTETLN